MISQFTTNWFKEHIAPVMEKKYTLEFRTFINGDFGDLERFEFNTKNKGGGIEFWDTGWVGIHMVDYIKGEELINVMIEPEQEEEKKAMFQRLIELM